MKLQAYLLLCLPGTGYAASVIIIFQLTSNITINSNVSSSVFNETNVVSEIDCSMRCLSRDCAAISWRSDIKECLVTVISNATTADSGSFVQRVIGGGDGQKEVWKTLDFEKRVILLSTKQVPVDLLKPLYSSTNSGPNGSLQYTVLNATGCYFISAWGAAGGSVPPHFGGVGARVAGNFSLTAGTNLTIVVGQKGGNKTTGTGVNAGSGGGGGSFVYVTETNSLLLAAGGGGGASNSDMGSPGQASTNGSDSVSTGVGIRFNGFGGSNGQAGIVNVTAATASYYFGGAGAGWLNKSRIAQRYVGDACGGGSRTENWIGGLAGAQNLGAFGGFGGG